MRIHIVNLERNGNFANDPGCDVLWPPAGVAPAAGVFKRAAPEIFFGERRDVADENDEYGYDEATGEWRPASEMAAVRAEQARFAMLPGTSSRMAIPPPSSRI